MDVTNTSSIYQVNNMRSGSEGNLILELFKIGGLGGAV